MRILYFTAADSPHDRRFLRALAETPHQVFALRMHDCQPQTPVGIRSLVWPEGRPDWSHWAGWAAGKTQFAAILADVKPNLVHAGPVQGPALLAAMSGFHPLVTMSWGSDLLVQAGRSPWMRFATTYALARTDVFVGDCQTVARRAAEFGFPQHRMVLFPWGVDLDHFSPENGRRDGTVWRESLAWQDHFVVMCNRTWAPLYGVDVLARAFRLAVDVNPSLRLLLAGDGPQAGLIRDLLSPVGSYVHFPGRVDFEGLPGLYCAGDVFVSPSHSDGSSISLLEALACGRTVLVSDIPSNREWIRPGDTGELFKDRHASDLAKELLKMAAQPNLADYQIRARQLAENRADWEKNFNELLRAYWMAARK